MTVQQMLDFIRNRHNEASASTPNWSDDELFALIEAKCNEALSILGLYEAIDTSLSTLTSTNEYTIPTDIVRLRRVSVNGIPLKYVNWRQYESRQSSGTIASGSPREWTQFAGTLFFDKTPSTASQTIKLLCEKRQGSITSISSTINAPTVFHYAICDGVLADTFAKDLNMGMAQFYERRWSGSDGRGGHKADMREYAKRRKRVGSPTTVIDADSVNETEHGVV